MLERLARGLALALLVCGASGAPLGVRLVGSLPSPQPVGTPIELLPEIDSMGKGLLVFRYSVSADNGPFHIVRDFSQQREFIWTPALYEHTATVRVTVRNNETKEMTESEIPFQSVSRVKNSLPVITPTSSPLVALFSAPSCPADSRFRVAFRLKGDETLNRTSLQPCVPTRSNNVYVTGMRADTDYEIRAESVNGGSVKPGSWTAFHTGLLDGGFPPVSVVVPRVRGSGSSEPVLIHSVAALSGYKRPFATDMDARIIWYLQSSDLLTRVLPGGRFLVLGDGANSGNDMKRLQILREVDLAGSVIHETNITRVAEQLERCGIHSDCKKGGKECVSGFHHEAIRLPNGHTLAIAGLERMLSAGIQDATAPVDVLGDLVIDLDEDFQVTGVWNSFDHLDLKRKSLQDAKCAEGPGRGGCPPIFLASQANGWTHSNSLNYMADTGDFLLSMPEQDWVVKIDWRDGKGTGNVLWRLGAGGDFTAKSDDPNPWFSYQHDAGFEPAGSKMISVLDDGHARQKDDPKAHTRGQLWQLDEASHTATLLKNADLGVYSIAVGSAQSLANGGYSFEAGFINPASPCGRSVEVSPDGKIVYAQQVQGLIEYRSFRVPDMYSAPAK